MLQIHNLEMQLKGENSRMSICKIWVTKPCILQDEKSVRSTRISDQTLPRNSVLVLVKFLSLVIFVQWLVPNQITPFHLCKTQISNNNIKISATRIVNKKLITKEARASMKNNLIKVSRNHFKEKGLRAN